MVENPEIILLFLGPTVGFIVFLVGVSTMDGIFVRPDNENNKTFTLDGFKDFIKAPFQFGTTKFKVLWGLTPDVDIKGRLKMLQLNWVAMTSLGLVGGATLSKVLSSILK